MKRGRASDTPVLPGRCKQCAHSRSACKQCKLRLELTRRIQAEGNPYYPDQELSDVVHLTGEVLGKGSFGVLRKALLRPHGTVVAVKTTTVAPNRREPVKETADWLMLEVEVLRRLSDSCSASIPRMHELLFDGERGVLHYIMELIVGPDLDKYCKASWSASGEYQDWVALVAEQLGRGLRCIHESGIAHRDIKPDNAMWDEPSQRGVWIDFGLACVADTKESDIAGLCRVEVGTPGYAAPDLGDWNPERVPNVANVLETWQRADVYVFGLMLWDLVVGTGTWRHMLEGSDRDDFSETRKLNFIGVRSPGFEHLEAASERTLAETLRKRGIRVSGRVNEILRSCLVFDGAKRWSAWSALWDASGTARDTPQRDKPETPLWPIEGAERNVLRRSERLRARHAFG